MPPCWSVLVPTRIPAAAVLIQMVGEYRDRYIRRDGRWWITEMIMRQRSFVSRSIAEDGAVAYAALPGEAALSVADQD